MEEQAQSQAQRWRKSGDRSEKWLNIEKIIEQTQCAGKLKLSRIGNMSLSHLTPLWLNLNTDPGALTRFLPPLIFPANTYTPLIHAAPISQTVADCNLQLGAKRIR
jgi:hypothetical protein